MVALSELDIRLVAVIPGCAAVAITGDPDRSRPAVQLQGEQEVREFGLLVPARSPAVPSRVPVEVIEIDCGGPVGAASDGDDPS
jgi:hypothetical protein